MATAPSVVSSSTEAPWRAAASLTGNEIPGSAVRAPTMSTEDGPSPAPTITCADAGREVDEVALAQRPLFVLDHDHAFAVEDQECLLAILAVVHGRALAGLEDPDVDPELGEVADAGLEHRAAAQGVRPKSLGVRDVDDEPAFALGGEARLGFADMGFLDACFHLSSSFRVALATL